MIAGYVLCIEKGMIKIKRKEAVNMKPRVELIEALFGKSLLDALYEDYLFEWSLNCYSRDETATVGLWLAKDRLSEKDFESLVYSFVGCFFDSENPFFITTHGKLGYKGFCHALYEQWVSFIQITLTL